MKLKALLTSIIVMASLSANAQKWIDITSHYITNAGFDGGVVVDKILSSGKVGYGYNAYTEEYCDMIASGIVDPTKVTRSSLENAASIAGCVLTTESLVVDKPDPAADAAAAAGHKSNFFHIGIPPEM